MAEPVILKPGEWLDVRTAGPATAPWPDVDWR
jgi:hypothetical protein